MSDENKTFLKDIDGTYPAAKFASIMAQVETASDYRDGMVRTNITDEFPAGHDLVVRTSFKRGVKTPSFVGLYAIPDVATITAANKDYVNDLVASTLTRRLSNMVLRNDGAITELPRTVAEFIERARGSSEGTKAFDAVWQSLRDALKNKTKVSLRKDELKSCMSSTKYAEIHRPAFESAGIFLKLLEAAKQLAAAEEVDITLFEKWETTRNDVVVDNVDLDAIDFAF